MHAIFIGYADSERLIISKQGKSVRKKGKGKGKGKAALSKLKQAAEVQISLLGWYSFGKKHFLIFFFCICLINHKAING